MRISRAKWFTDSEGTWLCVLSDAPAEVKRQSDIINDGKPHECMIKRARRSLDANGYAWQLISQIADKLRADKDEIYAIMLERYGQSAVVTLRADINAGDYFKYYRKLADGTANGTAYTHYKAIRGSSEYDTREMSIFIDGIISEAKSLNINTDTPEYRAMYERI